MTGKHTTTLDQSSKTSVSNNVISLMLCFFFFLFHLLQSRKRLPWRYQSVCECVLSCDNNDEPLPRRHANNNRTITYTQLFCTHTITFIYYIHYYYIIFAHTHTLSRGMKKVIPTYGKVFVCAGIGAEAKWTGGVGERGSGRTLLDIDQSSSHVERAVTI